MGLVKERKKEMDRSIVKKSVAIVTLGMLIVGCVSIYGNATEAEMSAEVVPTYVSPLPLTEISPLGSEALTGEWSANVCMDTKNVIPKFRRVMVQPGAYMTQTYKFFSDGQYLFTNKAKDGTETSSNGSWKYKDGILTISETKAGNGVGQSMRMKVVWYGHTQMELRIEDLSNYENLFRQAPAVKSVTARYEADGSLRTNMQMNNNGIDVVIKMIQSPLRFTRSDDVN